MGPSTDQSFMALALLEAAPFVGRTAPNPPVGAVVVGAHGHMLAGAAHQRAGMPHAEALALQRAREQHGADALRGATVYVTLEPCNHQGRTPPCAEALIAAGIKRVVMGCADPNPNVAGGGAARLKAAGITTDWITGTAHESALSLIAPFARWSTTGLPYVVHKIALQEIENGSLTMIPALGEKTFTSPDSLRLAHLERRQSDGILTGMGTVLADQPHFTVRHLPEHPEKIRPLAVIGDATRLTIPQKNIWNAWVERQNHSGFQVSLHSTVEAALSALGQTSCLRVLAEAGPQLSEIIRVRGLWQERLVVIKPRQQSSDIILRSYRETDVHRHHY